jgi:hypothetical protein
MMDSPTPPWRDNGDGDLPDDRPEFCQYCDRLASRCRCDEGDDE